MIETLGWTLVHFLWQGVLIAALLALASGRKPQTRYATACAALLLMLIAPLVTFWRLSTAVVAVTAPGAGGAVLFSPISAVAPPAGETALVWMVRIWLCGVLVCSLRWIAAWWILQRYERAPIEPEWQQVLARLCRGLAVSGPVRLYRSARIAVPVVIGWLRPVILMPAGALAGLSSGQLEAILGHELAHIRRHDWIINLGQILIETLLFYHPAVWWVSTRIRREREHCCDDLAVAACGDRLLYARALLELEQLRGVPAQAALAATGGSLGARIERLLGPGRSSDHSSSPWLAAVALAVASFAALSWAAQSPATPYDKWLTQDVVYIITAEERQKFLRLRTDSDRVKFIEAFWQRRGGEKSKKEHYRRIAWADERYGWKTDPGRIYITFGPPDEIESHPTEGRENWLYHNLNGRENVELEFRNGKLVKSR